MSDYNFRFVNCRQINLDCLICMFRYRNLEPTLVTIRVHTFASVSTVEHYIYNSKSNFNSMNDTITAQRVNKCIVVQMGYDVGCNFNIGYWPMAKV